MGRPIKIGLDYFPLDVSIDDNLELIEAEHGLPGFSIVIKLWQKIYSSGYFIEWDDDTEMLFARKINSEKTLVNSVIKSCFKRNIFDKTLFDEYGILTSSGIQKRFLHVCKSAKRSNISMIEPFVLVNSEFTDIITEKTAINSEFSTQSKVKESKVKEYMYNQFYDSEISKTENEKYHRFVKYLFGDNSMKEPLSGVLSIKKQLTVDEFENVIKKCEANKKKIGDILTKIENDPKYYKGKKSLYRTLLNWIGDRFV